MNPFVEECRREWRRLRVPDAVAEEMAVDLAADLREGEAEGISAEEVLGSGAFDPRSFAASWAAARGVIPSPPVPANPPGRPVRVGLVLAVSVIGALGAALVLLLSGNGSAVSVAPQARPFPPPLPPDLTHRVTAVGVVDAAAGLLLVLAIIGMAVSAYLWISRRRSRPPVAPA